MSRQGKKPRIVLEEKFKCRGVKKEEGRNLCGHLKMFVDCRMEMKIKGTIRLGKSKVRLVNFLEVCSSVPGIDKLFSILFLQLTLK